MSYDHPGEPQPFGTGERRQLPSPKLIALLVVVVAALVFFFQNDETVNVEFLWLDVNWPERTLILISIALGVVLDRLVTWQWRRSRRNKAEDT